MRKILPSQTIVQSSMLPTNGCWSNASCRAVRVQELLKKPITALGRLKEGKSPFMTLRYHIPNR